MFPALTDSREFSPEEFQCAGQSQRRLSRPFCASVIALLAAMPVWFQPWPEQLVERCANEQLNLKSILVRYLHVRL